VREPHSTPAQPPDLARRHPEHRVGGDRRTAALAQADEGLRAAVAHVEAVAIEPRAQAVDGARGGDGREHARDAPPHDGIDAVVEQRVDELARAVRGGAAQGGHEIAEELVAAEEGQGDGDQGGIQDLPSQHGADARGIAGAQLVRRILRRDGHGCVGRRGLGRREGPAIEIVHGLAGRRVLDLRLLEGDRPCAQARHERGDVGAMEAQRDARHRERARRGQADEHQGRARPHGREHGGRDQAARDRPHPVGPDVHEGLGRPLPPRRQRRVEELVGGPEDGMPEHGLRAAEDGDRAQPREGRRRRGQERDAQRMHGERPSQAEPRQRPAHERRLHEQGEDARRGLEGGEEPDERLPASQPRDRRRAQRVVEERLQQRAERDERGQRAKVRGLGEDPHHGSAGAVISGRLLRARGGRRQASHAERAQCDQRGHAEKKGRRRHELRRALSARTGHGGRTHADLLDIEQIMTSDELALCDSATTQ